MASSVFPGLVAQGYAVTLYTSAAGETVCRHDPHLAAIETIEVGEQPDRWAAIASTYDHAVNLGGSLEYRRLFKPSQVEFYWPDAQRRAAVGGVSYLRYLHEIAAVPGAPAVRFYATDEERAWADATRATVGAFVFIQLRGSAQYKWTPHLPEVVCRLLSETTLAVVLSGDEGARGIEWDILEAASRFTPHVSRIFSVVGDQPIRRVIALAQRAAAVVGPETGVMTAVGFEPMPKVVLLSHSSPANLTAEWVHAIPLEPTTDCYPCHRLHASADTCRIDGETGAAACALSVTPARLLAAVREALAGASLLAGVA